MTEATAITRDHLLDGRVILNQPASGYRVAIDPVLLAASIPARDGERVLEAGVGTAAAALCLATRLPGVKVAGIERQRELVRLAQQNVSENKLARRVDIMAGDLKEPPARLAAASFHHVMMNPPFLDPAESQAPPDVSKAEAHVEGLLEGEPQFDDWIRFALKMVRHKGTVTVIHRADRLGDVLSTMEPLLGDLVIFPLWPNQDKTAKRILVRGRKGVKTPLSLRSGLVLHEAKGPFTPEAERILRHGAALEL